MGDFELVRPFGDAPLAEDDQERLYRALFGKGEIKAIVRATSPGSPAGETARRFDRQYHAALAAGPSATPAPLYLGPFSDGIVLVTEDRFQTNLAKEMEEGPLPLADALALALKISKAVAAFHRAGWLHRSLRPAHVGITPDGDALLIGLGYARRIGDTGVDSYSLPASADQMGYLAPEQTGRIDRQMDWRTDIFSIGAMLHGMLSGLPPFRGKDAASVLYDCIAATPPALSSMRPDVSPFLSKVVDRAMAKNPDERYLTVAGLMDDLKVAMAHSEPGFDAEPGSTDRPESRFWAGTLPRDPSSKEPLGFGRIVQWIQNAFPDAGPRREALGGAIMAAGISDAPALENFMLSLAGTGCVSFEAPRGAWTIVRDLSSDVDLGSSIDAIVPEKLAAMGEDAIRFLECASCAGDEFDPAAVQAVLHQPDPEEEILPQALETGLIVPVRATGEADPGLRGPAGRATYRFSHLSIRRRLYEGLESIRRSTWHSAFAERYENAGRPELAVPHILADPLRPRRRDEIVRRAQVFLEASVAKATTNPEQSFALAARAHTLLGAAGWRDAYRLTLGACLQYAAQAALLGREDEFNTAIIELKADSRENDFTAVHVAAVAGYTALGKSAEAVAAGLSALQRLGYPLPAKPTPARALLSYLYARLLFRLGGDPLSPKRRQMPAGRPREAMRILVATGTSAYFARPNLVPVMVGMGLRLVARHGDYAGTAVFYAAMGFMESGVFRSYRSGYRLASMAEDLAARSASEARYCQTRLMASSFATHWIKPYRDTMNSLLDAARTGKALGDFEFSSLAYSAFLQASILEGSGIQHIVGYLPEIESSMRSMGQDIHLILMEASIAFIEKMRDGNYSSDAPVLRGESLKAWQERLQDRGLFALACDLALYRGLLAYAYGDFDDAADAVTAISPDRSAYASQYRDTLLTYLEAILHSRLRLAGKTTPRIPAKRRRDPMKKASASFKRWAAINPAIYESKRDALLGIQAYDKNARMAGFDLLERSSHAAKASGNLLDEALISAEYSFRLELGGRGPAAAVQLRNSYDALVRWGAQGAAQALAERYPTLNAWVKASHEGPYAGGLRIVDAEALIQASSALVAEMNPGKLAERLLELAKSLTGARFGTVWIRSGQSWQAKSGDESELPPRIEEAALILRPIVNPREAGGGSAALIPLVNRARAIGVVHLRNDLVTDAFPPQRLGIVEVIAAQAAVALENADLYEGLERKVRERTMELEEALGNVRRLRGLIPICSSCKKVRDDTGYWSQVEEYISARTEADFTHGLCPDCLDRYYDDMGVPPERRMQQPG